MVALEIIKIIGLVFIGVLVGGALIALFFLVRKIFKKPKKLKVEEEEIKEEPEVEKVKKKRFFGLINKRKDSINEYDKEFEEGKVLVPIDKRDFEDFDGFKEKVRDIPVLYNQIKTINKDFKEREFILRKPMVKENG